MPIYHKDAEGRIRHLDSLPDLSSAKRLCVDVETYDPNMDETGPSIRTGGYIASYCVGAEFESGEIKGYYVPVDHYKALDNHNKEEAIEWLQDLMDHDTREVLFANAMYDLDYLKHDHDIDVKGKIVDVLAAEALIDENNRRYSLDAVCKKYLDEGKDESDLYQYCADRFGGKPTRGQISNIWRTPPAIAAPYGVGDAELPLKVWRAQRQEMNSQDLWNVFNLESKLTKTLLGMKQRGVRVETEAADNLEHYLQQSTLEIQHKLNELAGFEINVDSNDHMVELYEKYDLPYGRTAPSKTHPEGQPSFTNDILVQSDIGQLVSDLRTGEKLLTTFVRGYIQKYQVNGRIHPEFNALRGDEYGTVTGRLSSSRPNLQNVPGDPRIRGMFIPDDGRDWFKLDYSSVEYRLAIHYAQGPAADSMRKMYLENPNFDGHRQSAADFHDVPYDDVTKEQRKGAKGINFGVIYGMGLASTAKNLGLEKAEAKRSLDRYHKKVPFMKKLAQRAKKAAEDRGYVKTMSGRRRRFDRWEPSHYVEGKRWKAYPRDRVEEEYHKERNAMLELGRCDPKVYPKFPRFKRAMCYKALNAIIQGTAADIMKKGMIDADESGVFDVIGYPMLTVHDELDLDLDPNNTVHMEALRELKHCMENAYSTRVPLVVDVEQGINWAQVREIQL